MATASTKPLTEPEARARLAAGKPLPLAWLWLLGAASDFEITVTNPNERGSVMSVKVEHRQVVEIRIEDGS